MKRCLWFAIALAFACGGSSKQFEDAPPSSVVTPVPQQLVGPLNATGLALDAQYVYWINQINDSVPGHVNLSRVAKTGGSPELLTADLPGGEAVGLVVNAGAIYWTMLACQAPCDFPGASEERVLFRLPLDTRAVERIGLGYGQLAFDDTYVYAGIPKLNGGPGRIVKYPRDGSSTTPFVIFDGVTPGTGLAVDASNVWWTTVGNPSNSADFWLAAKDGSFGGIHKGVGPANVALRLFVTPTTFFYRGANGVDRTGMDSGPELDLWNAPNGADLDMKDGRLYWNQSQTSQWPGCLGSANYDGTDGKCLDQGAHTYGGVRVDDTAIFFIRDGSIWRLNR